MRIDMRTKKPGDFVGGGWEVVECKVCGENGIAKGVKKKVFHHVDLYQKPNNWPKPCSITKRVLAEYENRVKQAAKDKAAIAAGAGA